MFGLAVFLTIFASAIFFYPNFISHPDNYIRANPMDYTTTHCTRMVFFTKVLCNTMVCQRPDKLGGVLLMFGAIMVLFILPWLDRQPIRSSNFDRYTKYSVLDIILRLYCTWISRCND